MPSPAEEAKAHVAMAEKALTTSWMSMRFSPDHLTASMEYAQAAAKYRSSGMLGESVRAWVASAELKEKMHDLFSAGRAYESAGGICDGSGPGGPPAAAVHWEKAVRCFRLCGKGDIAAKLILKMAAMHEKAGNITKARESFEEALEVFKQEEKDYNLTDVYKTYIGFLVRSEMWEDALQAIDGHVEVLVRQKHFPFVHKELISKTVLLLRMDDLVRAEDSLNTGASVEGWYTSKESEVGFLLVGAFQANDAESVERLVKEQVFTNLQVEIARIARLLRVRTLPTAPVVGATASETAAAEGGVGAGAPGSSQPSPEALGELLM